LRHYQLLVSNGANINAKNSHGQTPFHIAAGMTVDVARLLVSNGANVNARANAGYTPLVVARTEKKTANANTCPINPEHDFQEAALEHIRFCSGLLFGNIGNSAVTKLYFSCRTPKQGCPDQIVIRSRAICSRNPIVSTRPKSTQEKTE